MDFDAGIIPNVFRRGPMVLIEEIQDSTSSIHEGSLIVSKNQNQNSTFSQGIMEDSSSLNLRGKSKRELEGRSNVDHSLKKKAKIHGEKNEAIKRKQRAAEKLGKMTIRERCSMMVRALDVEEDSQEIPIEFQDMWEYMELISAKEKDAMMAKITGASSRGGGGWPSTAARSP